MFDLPVAEGPYPQVVRLQTMRCLFEAYEHVLSLLENVFTPMFCHSDEVSPPRARLGPPPRSPESDPSAHSPRCFKIPGSVPLQYFRQLLRGAESPARSSRMSRWVLTSRNK